MKKNSNEAIRIADMIKSIIVCRHVVCLHLYIRFISICQIIIYVRPLEEPAAIPIKLVYYRFVANEAHIPNIKKEEYAATKRSERIMLTAYVIQFRFTTTKTNPEQAC